MHFGRLIGTGGFTKTVAIKRLHRQFARDPTFRESILEEGRLAARIRHPNVVPPLDVLSEASELLLVMEYVHGESLSKLLKVAWSQDEVVPLAVGAAIMTNTLHGLHAAHEAKDEKGRPLDIVHRDVSPQNVLVGVDGIARVIDFGIAKAVTTGGESTSTGVIKGKVPYLAPEQLEGESATRRTDVYAASVVLWEVLAGHRLFQGEDDGEILRKILGMTVEPPSAYNPSVPTAIDEIVLRGLSRKPEQRFATAREMAIALEELVHPATASVVGAWCERLAVTALTKRAAQLAEVEASDKAAVSASSRPPPPSKAPASRPPPLGGPPSKPPPPPRPPVSLPPQFANVSPSTTFSSQTIQGRVAELSQMPDSQRGSAAPPEPVLNPTTSMPIVPPNANVFDVPAAHAPTVLAFDDGQPPSTNRSGPRPPAAGQLRKPALEIANVEWLPQEEPPKRGPIRIGRIFAGILFLALIVTFACLPMIARSLILKGAAERGLVLEVGRVEVSRHAIKLVDVRVKTNDLPGMTLSATALDIELSRLQPSRFAFADMTLEIDGTYADVSRRIEQFRAKREAQVMGWASGVNGISVASGRIDWKNMFGPGTNALFENVSIDSDRANGRALGEDYHFVAPLVTLRSGATTAGPWSFDAQKRPTDSTATLKLDPSGTYPATVTWASTELDAYTVTFAVPRVALASVHLPASLFGPHTTGTTKVELRGEVTLAPRTTPNRPLAGRVTANATAIAVFPSAPPLDVAMDLPIAGDGTKPVALDKGTMALSITETSAQIASIKLLGSLDTTATRLALDIGGKSTPLACSGKGETKIDSRVTLIADRAGDTKLAFDANPQCTPKVFAK